MKDICINQNVTVYDPRVWNHYSKDVGNNEHCWKAATVRNIRNNVPSSIDDHVYPVLYDVEFLCDGFLSKGHFQDSIRLH